MTKKTNEVKSANNSSTFANVENVVTTNEVANETLPLKDVEVITDSIERGDSVAVKKSDCMQQIRDAFRAPTPSALELLGRFFRSAVDDDNENVASARVSLTSNNINIDDDMAVLSHIFSLPAPVALAVSRAASAWWRVAGDYRPTTLDDVIEFANKFTDLPNDVYFCEIRRDWLFVNGSLVVYSANDSDGAKNMLLPGCYYKVVDFSTANYIRAVGSLSPFLAAKRREMNGKISNIFALAPAVKEYITRILEAGFLDANDIGQIAIDAQHELDAKDADKKASLTAQIKQKEFEINEFGRQIADIKKSFASAGSAKIKKLNNQVAKLNQKLSAARTSLQVAKVELEKLQK